ncbi:SRPBCC family protein [Ekhidna sp. To15]|uniref:SRPBCC family protein n=1 Tax=Ekhidna sp. To15 TaxID=3395267 RepID=UPI003F528E0B
MKVLKIIGIIILILVALFLGLIIFGPSSGHLERKITINTTPDIVYNEVSNLNTFNKWSPWFQVDPDAEYAWEGPSSGEGSKMIWYSKNSDVGNGYMEITETRNGEFVLMDMGFDQNNNRDFTDEGEEKPTASFILESDGGSTNVTWTFDISGVSGMEKMMVVGLDMFLGPFYEQGLAALKERAESAPTFNVKIAVQDVDPITFAGKEVSSANNQDEISTAMGQAYSDVMEAIMSNNLNMTEGYPLAIATNYSEESISMICGIPVAEGSSIENNDVTIMQSPDGRAIRALHFGDYSLLLETHEQIDQYAKYYGYELTGNPWEIYVTDPSVETDTSKWITEVYYPTN